MVRRFHEHTHAPGVPRPLRAVLRRLSALYGLWSLSQHTALLYRGEASPARGWVTLWSLGGGAHHRQGAQMPQGGDVRAKRHQDGARGHRQEPGGWEHPRNTRQGPRGLSEEVMPPGRTGGNGESLSFSLSSFCGAFLRLS